MFDYLFAATLKSLWYGVVGLVWIIKGIAWVMSAVLNRREINRPE